MILSEWNYYLDISDYEKHLFNMAACHDFSCYSPFAVANIDNIRYRFLCHSNISEDKSINFSIIELYKPRQGSPYVTKIIPIDLNL